MRWSEANAGTCLCCLVRFATPVLEEVTQRAAIGYGRRASPLPEKWDRDRQTTALLTYTENRVTNAIESPDAHRNPLPCEGGGLGQARKLDHL
jgi:hypothetical protein